MLEDDRKWMAYIDAEVRAVCEAKGWKSQIRRGLSVREKPVAESPVEDYEWKLIPDAAPESGEAPPDGYEGVYYVLSFDRRNERFILQHDTTHCGVWGPHFEESTYTEIRPIRVMLDGALQSGAAPACPAAGWLRDHLLDLTTRYGPNTFSIT